jgi:CubicO group peptidase (beta-lactamase class C family)
MTATSSRFADFEKRPNRAFGHVKVGDGFQPKYQRLPDPESPAGGVSSSASDLARWLALVLQNGKFEGRQIIPAVTASGRDGRSDFDPLLRGRRKAKLLRIWIRRWNHTGWPDDDQSFQCFRIGCRVCLS